MREGEKDDETKWLYCILIYLLRLKKVILLCCLDGAPVISEWLFQER